MLRLTLCCRTKKKVILKLNYRKEIAEPPTGRGDDAVVRAPASLYSGPGSDPGPDATCARTRVEFVVGSGPDYGGFSPTPLVFLPSQKPTL